MNLPEGVPNPMGLNTWDNDCQDFMGIQYIATTINHLVGGLKHV